MDDGTTSYKPNSTQIGLVVDAFDNKDINLHVDTGEYGGGNELPAYIEALKFEPTASETDFFNLKNGDGIYSASFADERRGVWHYMITGDKLYDGESNTTSGVSYAGDDDAFVALGQVGRDNSLTQNQAIAGTMIHELGHNLCLSSSTYTGQDPTCIFSGVDTYASSDYDSAMNYNKQFLLVNYSDGSNGSNDHNDWAAILVGMDDFVTLGSDPTEPSFGAKLAFDKKPIYEKTTTDELHKAAERQAAEKDTEAQNTQNTQSSHETQNSPNKSENEAKAKHDSSSQFKWTPLLLDGGTALLSIAIGTTWYMKSKRKK